MSEPVAITEKRKFFDGFSTGQLVATVLAAIATAIVAAAISVWVTQAQTLQRLTTLEKEQDKTVTKELLDERWKTVDRIDRNVEQLRDLFLPDKRRDDRK